MKSKDIESIVIVGLCGGSIFGYYLGGCSWTGAIIGAFIGILLMFFCGWKKRKRS
jgi:membrane associated rhomboid family serine protease